MTISQTGRRMEVTVTFTTQLKAALGVNEKVVTLNEGATVQGAIDALAAEHPEQFGALVLSGGKLLPSILLSVNDAQVSIDSGVSDGDTITLLSAISGG